MNSIGPYRERPTDLIHYKTEKYSTVCTRILKMTKGMWKFSIIMYLCEENLQVIQYTVDLIWTRENLILNMHK